MSEIQSLKSLRDKLVTRRRKLVESLVSTPADQLTGDAIARIQNAIDAVDRALEDESKTAAGAEDSRRRAS